MKKLPPPQTIGIFQMAKLGDMICTTPLIRATRNAFPTARIFVIGNALNAEVLAGNPDFSDVKIPLNLPPSGEINFNATFKTKGLRAAE